MVRGKWEKKINRIETLSQPTRHLPLTPGFK